MDILQFEYAVPGTVVFLQVHHVFKHHCTGETMRFVQQDWVDKYGAANSRFIVMDETAFKFAYEARIEANGET